MVDENVFFLKIVHEARTRAGRCAAAASQIKVEAQGEEKLEDLLELGGAERLSIGLRGDWNKAIAWICGFP